jgi:hypothetical protein
MATPLARALLAATFILQSSMILGGGAIAQTAPPAQSREAPAEQSDEEKIDQKPLTEAIIQQFLDAQDSIDDIVSDIPDDELDEPDPKIQAKLDKTARRFGFKDYGDYDEVANTIGFLLGGFDPDTKAFVGHETMVKRQIAEVENDGTLRKGQKKAQLRELDEMLRSIVPVKYPDNIALVAKSYDKLAPIFDDDD